MPANHKNPPGTLAWFAEGGPTAYLLCEECRRFTRPDFEKLAQKANDGWSSRLGDLAPKLRYQQCGHLGAVKKMGTDLFSIAE